MRSPVGLTERIAPLPPTYLGVGREGVDRRVPLLADASPSCLIEV